MNCRRDTGTTNKNGRGIRGRFREEKYLIQAEIHFDIDSYCDRFAIFHGGLEFPLPGCFDFLLVQNPAPTAGNAEVTRRALPTDNPREKAGSLILCFSGFF